VVTGTRAGDIHALETATGTERWRTAVDAPVLSSPTVAGGTAFVGGGTAVHAVETATNGSGNGSRVLLGTLGHHDTWTGDPAAVGIPGDDSAGETGADEQRPERSAAGDGVGDDGTDGHRAPRPWSSPGVVGALVGFVGASYLLKRKLDGRE
jgi:hypothetical protein